VKKLKAISKIKTTMLTVVLFLDKDVAMSSSFLMAAF